jgi:hypothetical protein
MEFITSTIAWVQSPMGAQAFIALFALSEFIGWLPGVKASGVFQAVQNGLRFVISKVSPKLPPV